ncbi:MAG: cysteine desulfurase [Alphaproteobacteria bacterium]|nr:cysteine desulfurase [Alphaproteobacteria bacterium]
MASKRVYLDYNGSTPVAPEVADTVRQLLGEHHGNPSALHWASTPARRRIDDARAEVAGLLNGTADEVVFTSGGTESINTALKGAFYALQDKGRHIVTTAIEHPATLSTCQFLERIGAEVTILGVDRDGRVDPASVEAVLRNDTILVSVMHANGEVGTIQPIADIARITRERGMLLHTDAAQSAGKIPTDVRALGVDLLSLAGHKMYAPKGVGALFIRDGVTIEPLIHGADHQAGRRAGTENVALAAGMGVASRIAGNLGPMETVKHLRDGLHMGLQEIFADRLHLNGHPVDRLPNTLNVSIAGAIGGDVLARLDHLAATTGSACHEGDITLSPVLEAMGVPVDIGGGAIRFSLGRATTADVIDRVLSMFADLAPSI